MSELPQGWAWSTLQTACAVVRGITFPATAKEPKPTDANVCCLRTSNIQQQINWKDVYYVNRSYVKREDQLVQPGDVLMSMANSYELVGKVAKVLHVPSPTAFGAFLSAVRPTQAVNGDYLFHFLRTDQVQSELREGSSQTTNIANISVGRLSSIAMPLAPAAEQTRIANQLNTLLARVQACNDRFDAIPALLKRFRQTVLTAAASGDLTRDWRESKPPAAGAAAKEVKHRLDARRNRHAAKSKSKFKEPVQADLTHWRLDVPESWSVESVSAFAECLDHVRVPVTKDRRATAERLYPYFGANGQVDMVDDFLFDDELVMVTEDETFYGRVKPIAYRFSGRCWVNNHAHVLLAGDRVRADYLCFSLMHYDVQPWLTGTTGRAKLTQGALNALPLAVPPQAEMVEIVRRVNFMFALADRIEARCTGARAQAQRLTPLVLAKAFRGELVAQDPADEPAGALLARITTERTSPTQRVKAAAPPRRRTPVAH